MCIPFPVNIANNVLSNNVQLNDIIVFPYEELVTLNEAYGKVVEHVEHQCVGTENTLGGNKDFGKEYDEEIPLDGQSVDYDPDDKEDNTSDKYKKQKGHDIYLKSRAGQRVEVCRVFLLTTLTLDRDTYFRWCSEKQKEKGTNGEQVLVEKRNYDNIASSKEKIAIHTPRQELCNTCCGYKAGTVSSEKYQKRLKRKDEARAAKNTTKGTASSEKFVDNGLASEVSLYVWHEALGAVSSNEFTSCLINYIRNSADSYKKVVLISEGCNYQNRTKVLSSALSNIAVEKSIVIIQLYLEKGHTMMEADSVHSTFEQYFKPPINSPMDYVA
ncbi:hypothetical protein ILUMI_02116 [Ignelater luminosus]|uniref:Uncharacterized protein n=1 Tax=Ignelater luminosus TaxID=2038154 RepID=A0A8K0DDB1_IGNLU|nr:hypothetical protein ILUMI_02116 [Ignelater luminosus]